MLTRAFAGKLEPEKIAAAAATAPLPWAQRLGYLLDLVGASEKTTVLASRRAASAEGEYFPPTHNEGPSPGLE